MANWGDVQMRPAVCQELDKESRTHRYIGCALWTFEWSNWSSTREWKHTSRRPSAMTRKYQGTFSRALHEQHLTQRVQHHANSTGKASMNA
eukprot:UN3279